MVLTIRTECLDHRIVIDEPHLRAVLAEFADYYNSDRRHRSHCDKDAALVELGAKAGEQSAEPLLVSPGQTGEYPS